MTPSHRSACTKMLRAAARARTAKTLAITATSVRVPCSDASHDLIKQTAFESLRNVRPWPDAGLEIGECQFCNSSLCREMAGKEAA